MVLAMDHADHYFYSRTDIQKIKVVKKGIAFFDFDGTITTKDTLLEFIKHSKGPLQFYLGFILNSPYLLAYKFKIISNQSAKEKVLQFFFKNTPLAEFDQKCRDFVVNALPSLMRPKALEEIKTLQQQGVPVVIVSASPENWIKPWVDLMQLKLIATRLEVNNNQLTGKIVEYNCHGEEKVRRIKQDYELTDYDTIFAYGDSSGDKPMLGLATAPHYKPFR
jgi:HAD superfamily hydrolase (TIGR01490 family)